MNKELGSAKYLCEYVGMCSSTIHGIDKYEQVLWFSEMPQEEGCNSPAWSDGRIDGEPWLVVKKQVMPTVPPLPENLRPWVVVEAIKKASEDVSALSLK
jgi:hypothetical protein